MTVTIISLVVVILFLVLFGWTWHSLGNIEKTTKIFCIIGGLAVAYLITFLIYNISKRGITYENQEAMKLIQNVFVALFTIINSYIILPYVFKRLDKINNDEIEKEQLIKNLLLLIAIIVVVAIFESSYLESIQKGILNMINQ